MIHFYGTHNEDYMADPLSPIHWHCFKETAGLGALGDLAAHIVNMAQYLVGDIEQVWWRPGRSWSRHVRGKAGSAEMIAVENEDQAHAMVRFAAGRRASLKPLPRRLRPQDGAVVCHHGTKGAISFTPGSAWSS